MMLEGSAKMSTCFIAHAHRSHPVAADSRLSRLVKWLVLRVIRVFVGGHGSTAYVQRHLPIGMHFSAWQAEIGEHNIQ